MISIYNTLTRKKEEFNPIKEGHVGIYLCGPTVYDSAHLGHGRSAVSFDMIRKYFIYKGYEVNFVSNYTDIDDKMINRANEEGISVKELSEKVIPRYIKDYGDLKIEKSSHSPRATNYIDQIINLIKKLEEKGATYELEDGIYFDIKAFPEYGKLSKQNLEDLQMGSRVKVNKDKKNPQDFALWKKEKPGEPSWDSPWGKGRPGWHIECSAMSMDILGETFDIHGGGADLTFPHHDCEIAQSECATNKQFARYWMHNGFININEEKMSKSLGNFITLRDVLDKYDGSVVRYLYLQTHYRSPINFTDEILESSKNGLERIHDFISWLKRDKKDGQATEEITKAIEVTKEKFELAMDDDFETPAALAAVFELIKAINSYKGELTTLDQTALLEFLEKVDSVFNFLFPEDFEIPEEIKVLMEERKAARENKDWSKSDEIRDNIKEKGFLVEDTPSGQVLKKI